MTNDKDQVTNMTEVDGTTHLATASSKRDEHVHRNGQSCKACRWFEVTLSRTTDDRYRVELIGRTALEGETDRVRVETMRSPHAVVDLLTMRQDGRVYIPWTSRQALHDAAELDTDLGAALDDFDALNPS